MIEASELLNNLVAMLRDIPEIVTAMGGDPMRIYPYHDSYPKNVSYVHAIHAMPAPAIMAVWMGIHPEKFGGMDVWNYDFKLFLRAKEESTVGTAYTKLFKLIVKGIPTKAGIAMVNATVLNSCYPMNLPSTERQSDAEGLDYFEVPLSFTEIGDQ